MGLLIRYTPYPLHHVDFFGVVGARLPCQIARISLFFERIQLCILCLGSLQLLPAGATNDLFKGLVRDSTLARTYLYRFLELGEVDLALRFVFYSCED